MNDMNKFFPILLFFFAPSIFCLKNVSVNVVPLAVERGKDATLMCNYDLEGAPLYSMKWYRGVWEFYRFSPNDNPPTKIFPYDGIHVDISMSNATQVVLRQVGFSLSGNLSCEVTTDAPFFSSAIVSKELMVIELPKRGPLIQTQFDRYDVGDFLRANCSTAPSKPPASLSFFLNDNPVGVPGTRVYDSGNSLQHSILSLDLTVEPAHMSPNGHLVLRCTALIATLFRQSSELSLGPRTAEPVPERVTSPSSCTRSWLINVCLMGFLIFILEWR